MLRNEKQVRKINLNVIYLRLGDMDNSKLMWETSNVL